MLDVLWLAATWLLAAVYVRGAAWSSLLSPLEIGVASVAGGTAAAVWAVFLVSSLFGSLSVFSVLVATCLLAAAAYARYTAAPRPLPRLALARSQWVGCALLGACLLPTWRLYSTRMLPEDEYGNIIAAGSCYGDLPIHMNIAQSFLIGANINFSWSNMHSTIFAGAPLTYPFLPDFHAAIFVVLGGTLRRAFLWTGVGMVLALFAAIYSLALRMSKSPAAGLIAVVLTVCAGDLLMRSARE
ncbi:hypothetical protein EON67_12400 [archaeon]|nr:MAG: hypothetical protein EON67_12400 [archaeon]